MSTPCLIAIQRPKTFGVVVCHSDGHPDEAGITLLHHYSDRRKLNQLIAGRDISILRDKIGRKHKHHEHYTGKRPYCTYPAVVNEWTTFYVRDRGEKAGTQNRQRVGSFIQLMQYAQSWGYLYAYTLQGKWRYWDSDTSLNNVNGLDDLPELTFETMVKAVDNVYIPEARQGYYVKIADLLGVPSERVIPLFPSPEEYAAEVEKREQFRKDREKWQADEIAEWKSKTGRYAPRRVAAVHG